MRRTRHGIEIKRGNITVTVSETSAREGIAKLREEDAQKATWKKEAAWDPSGFISRPGSNAVKGKRFAEPWRGSGAEAKEEVKTSYQARKVGGLTVQAGLSIEDALRLMHKPSE